MTDNKLLVSIGMPVYNGENYIRQALDSLLAQDHENLELVISDNASTDTTQEICLEYASKDPRIRYYRNAVNMGLDNNLNRVFELSSGEFFMWAAHDDIWEPNLVSTCVEVLQRDPSAVLCYTGAKCIGLDGNEIKEWPLPSFDTRDMNLISRFHVVIWGGPVFPVLGLIRSKALRRTGLFAGVLASDFVLQTELCLLGGFAYVPAPLFHKRVPYKGMPIDYENTLEEANIFFAKIGKPVTTEWSALYSYWQMVCAHARVVNRHVLGYRSKAILIPSVILCTLIKYRWLLKMLLDISGQREGQAPLFERHKTLELGRNSNMRLSFHIEAGLTGFGRILTKLGVLPGQRQHRKRQR